MIEASSPFYVWLIGYLKERRNKLVTTTGKNTIAEKELQEFLKALALSGFVVADLATLEEATDKNKFYEAGTIL